MSSKEAIQHAFDMTFKSLGISAAVHESVIPFRKPRFLDVHVMMHIEYQFGRQGS
jgi:hypothetical protein